LIPAGDGLGIGVQEELVRVKPQAIVRLIGTVHAVAIHQARASLGKIDAPDVVDRPGHMKTGIFARTHRFIEEAEFHAFGVLAEDGEVHSAAIPGGAERVS
jgi:hypothetical protein